MTAMTNPRSTTRKRILALDSGAGGLSIIESLRALFYHRSVAIELDFVADSACYPYGEKSKTQLDERISQLVEDALRHKAYDIIIIACNTASTQVLETLRAQTDIPIVGVVPAIKPSAEQSETKAVIVLATESTVDSVYLDLLCDQFAADIDITRIAAPELVSAAELYVATEDLTDLKSLQKVEQAVDLVLDKTQSNVLRKQRDSSAPTPDCIVLACTHFPLLRNILREKMVQYPALKKAKLIDSGHAVAMRVVDLLKLPVEKGAEPDGDSVQTPEFLVDISVTGDTNLAKDKRKTYLDYLNRRLDIK